MILIVYRTHSIEHYKRYRYYVSHKLIIGTKEASPQVLRIPAEELELAVIGRIITFLKHGVELLTITDGHGLDDATATHAVLDMAYKMAEQLEATALPGYASNAIKLLSTIIDRVIVRAHEIEIKLKLGSLISQAGATYHASAEAWKGFDWDHLTHTIILPVQLKRTGLAVKLIIEVPEHRIKRQADPKMVKLLCKAHDWFGQLSSGKVKSMKEIGDKEALHRT